LADPRTPFLGLTKPIVNDEAGEDLWGEKLNVNFDLLDTFASKQGALVEAPQDNKVYGRGTPEAWIESIDKITFDALSTKVTQNTDEISAVENVNLNQDTAINGKAPLGPSDGAIYGWKGTGWYQVSGSGGMTVDWGQITGKPPTYPPTLPIPSSGVTGLDAAQAAQDSAIAANVTAINGKEPAIATGNPAFVWHGDKTWKAESPFPEAPADGQLYSRKGSTASWIVASAGAVVADTPPTGVPISTIWWNSSSGGLFINYLDPSGPPAQWVMVNAAGMPEANKDGKPYARKDGGWFDLTATLAAYIDQGELNTALAGYLPLTGGVLSGQLLVTSQSAAANSLLAVVWASTTRCYLSAEYGINSTPAGASANGLLANATGSGAGVIAYMPGGTYYGACGYASYGLYTNYLAYAATGYRGGDIYVNSTIQTVNGVGIFGGTNTTASSANCNITTGGGLYRSTASTRAIKKDIEPMWTDVADKVLSIKTYWHRYRIELKEPEHFSVYSLMAEEVAAADPRFANWDRAIRYDADGKPKKKYRQEEHPDPDDPMKRIMIEMEDGFELEEEETPQHINWNAIVTSLLNVVQRQEARIQALEAKVGV
jgi:hypothetical protein